MSFPEPLSFNGAPGEVYGDEQHQPNAGPMAFRCPTCDWRGEGAILRACHYYTTGHHVRYADDPRFREAV